MQNQNVSNHVPSLARSLVTGAVGFGLVSLCVFATVAFAERWMYRTLGVGGAFVAWALLFVVLSGLVFGSLVRWRGPKFYLLFGLAFFAYAAGWMLVYFTVSGTAGEVIGSVAGSILMAVVLAWGFKSLRSTLKLSAVLFVTNAIGYFLGAALYASLDRPLGMLLWGIAYGVFFGGGIGAALRLVQLDSEPPL